VLGSESYGFRRPFLLPSGSRPYGLQGVACPRRLCANPRRAENAQNVPESVPVGLRARPDDDPVTTPFNRERCTSRDTCLKLRRRQLPSGAYKWRLGKDHERVNNGELFANCARISRMKTQARGSRALAIRFKKLFEVNLPQRELGAAEEGESPERIPAPAPPGSSGTLHSGPPVRRHSPHRTASIRDGTSAYGSTFHVFNPRLWTDIA